ncbi:MAG: tyrosine recombinase XerC [Tissierellia bacterium]|nr:tyrosine recombinase XerC [Tissierellia bacterium]
MNKDVPIYVIDFMNYLKTIKGLSSSTVNEYYYDCRLFLKYIKIRKNPYKYDLENIDDIDINDFSLDDLEKINLIDIHSYISYRDNNRDNNSTTRARKISSLRTFYKYMVTVTGQIKNNPTLDLETPKIKKRNPVYLTLDESTKLLETIAEEKNIFTRKRDFSIVLTFLTTGIRLSELSSMNINTIKDLQFSVIGKGNKERIVYMTEACKMALDDYINVRPEITGEEALYLSNRNNRMSNRAIQHMLDKYLLKCGLDIKIYSPHKLRHTAATLMYKEGVDIRTLQKILGHTSVATTQIYTHVEDDDMRKAINFNPLSKIIKSKK